LLGGEQKVPSSFGGEILLFLKGKTKELDVEFAQEKSALGSRKRRKGPHAGIVEKIRHPRKGGGGVPTSLF